MPKATGTRITRSTREKQPQRSQPARATKAIPQSRGQAGRIRVPRKSPTISPSLNEIEQLYVDYTISDHAYKFDDMNTPEFATASKKLGDAWNGMTAAGEAPPVYSEVYSYLPDYCRIAKNTPVPPGAFPMAYGGTVQPMLWSEEMVNAALKAEFGDVKKGLEFTRRMAQRSDIVGGSPDPADPSLRMIPIPDRSYHIRLWTGHMDNSQTACWQFISNKTKKPMIRPKNLKINDVTNSDQPVPLLSLEECWHIEKKGLVPQGVGETFAAADGAIVEFEHKQTPIFRIQMPSHPTKGPSRIRKYLEYKILPDTPCG
ncbi:hypothetical protein HDZ31DRAFT_31541 [Schizophyllum fasciatum]